MIAGIRVGSDGEWYKNMAALIRHGERTYGLKVRYKDESLFMKALGLLMFFNKGFMASYTTTLWNYVWFPSRYAVAQNPRSYFVTLAHELAHIDRYGRSVFRYLWFCIRYMFPQCLALLSLGAFSAIWVGPWGLVFLVFLAAAFPWPAPGRVREEIIGYAMSEVCWLWLLGRDWSGSKIDDGVVSEFTGSGYYWMKWGDASSVRTDISLRCGWLVAETNWALGRAVRYIALYGSSEYYSMYGE
jgi:hypothetical protein